MAVGPFTVYDLAIEKIARSTIDLDSHTFKAVLVGSNAALSASFAGTSTDCRLADVTQITGTGYTSGGAAITLTVNRSGDTVTVDGSDVSWGNSTIEAKGFIVYDDTHANDALVGFYDLNTDSGTATVSATGGDFNVGVNAGGLFTVARS